MGVSPSLMLLKVVFDYSCSLLMLQFRQHCPGVQPFILVLITQRWLGES